MTRQSVTQTQQQTPTTNPLSSGILQRKCASCGQHAIAGGECSECQKKRMPLQRRATNQAESSEVPPIVHEVLRSPGQPLNSDSRAFMESRFGQDFSQIRVHTDAKAAESARAVNALAYTVGQDVVFGSGQYASHTATRQQLLAHELAHTMQQRQGSSGRPALSPLSASEIEADRVSNAVVNGWAATEVRQHTGVGLARVLETQNVALLSDEELQAEHQLVQQWLMEHTIIETDYALMEAYFAAIETEVSRRSRGSAAPADPVAMPPSSTVASPRRGEARESAVMSGLSSSQEGYEAFTQQQREFLNEFGLSSETIDPVVAQRLATMLDTFEQANRALEGNVDGVSTSLEGIDLFIEESMSSNGSAEVTAELTNGRDRLHVMRRFDAASGQLITEISFLDENGNFISGRLAQTGPRRMLEVRELGMPSPELPRIQESSSPRPLSSSESEPEVTSSEEGIGSFLEGAILGDFGENDSYSAIAGQTVVGFIPIAGQIADIRDISAAIGDVASGEEGAWLNLGIAAVGIIPGLDFLKGGARIGRQALREGVQETLEASGRGLREATQETVTTVRRGEEAIERSAREIDPEIDEAVERIFADDLVDVPTARGGRSRPRIEGHRVPTRQTRRLDLEDIPRQAGETARQALARVRQVIGRRVSDVEEIQSAWNRARDQVLRTRTLDSSNYEELYNLTRQRFWQEVRNDPAGRQYFINAGFDFPSSSQTAPILRNIDPSIPIEETRVSLDHIQEKAIGDNWRRALDADNLRMEFQMPNTQREIIQSRHPELRQ